jgi:hypothetical protein
METERRRQLLLAAVAIVLAAVVYQAWPRTSATRAASSNERATAARPAATPRATAGITETAQGTPDVHLESLEAERPKPGSVDRNLFRFKPKAPPPPPPPTTKPMMPVQPPVPTGPPPPPPVPPITLKFIGLADVGPGKPKIAVLTDGLGPPESVREGEVAFGRYRVLKVGVESVELAYLDGRGRQTIRLSGS